MRLITGVLDILFLATAIGCGTPNARQASKQNDDGPKPNAQSGPTVAQHEDEAELKLLENLTKMETGNGYKNLGSTGPLRENGDHLIDIYKKATDVDQFVEALKNQGYAFREIRVSNPTGIARFMEMIITISKTDESYFMGVYYDRKTRRLVNYFFDVTFY